MLFLSARGFLDYAEPTDHSRCNAASHFAFLPLGTESAPCSSVFRSSIARPTDTTDLRFNMPVYPGAPRDTPLTAVADSMSGKSLYRTFGRSRTPNGHPGSVGMPP